MTEDISRGSGRTTNIILATVRKAIDKAGTEVLCRDHYDSWGMHTHVFKTVHIILNELNIDHIANTANCTIIVSPRPAR